MLFTIISLCITGLIIGALGRVAVPGRNPIGCLATILVGILGSLLGGVVALLLYHDPGEHPAVTFLLEVGCAALIVAAVSGTRRRTRP